VEVVEVVEVEVEVEVEPSVPTLAKMKTNVSGLTLLAERVM